MKFESHFCNFKNRFNDMYLQYEIRTITENLTGDSFANEIKF